MTPPVVIESFELLVNDFPTLSTSDERNSTPIEQPISSLSEPNTPSKSPADPVPKANNIGESLLPKIQTIDKSFAAA